MLHILLSWRQCMVNIFWQLSGRLLKEWRMHSGYFVSSAVVVSHTHSFTSSSMTIFRSCKGPLFRLHFLMSVCLSFCLCHVIVFVCVCLCVDVSVFHCLLMYYCAAIRIQLCARWKEQRQKKKKHSNKTNMAAYTKIHMWFKEKKKYLGSMQL